MLKSIIMFFGIYFADDLLEVVRKRLCKFIELFNRFMFQRRSCFNDFFWRILYCELWGSPFFKGAQLYSNLIFLFRGPALFTKTFLRTYWKRRSFFGTFFIALISILIRLFFIEQLPIFQGAIII